MIMVEVTKIWWDGERLMAEPVDSAIMYKDNEVAQPDSTCNNTLRAEGKGYPRTCKKCGKGPCIADRVQPEQRPPDAIPDAFNEWWNADYDDTGNPFRKDSPAYWAWSGWKAASKQPEQEPVAEARYDGTLHWLEPYGVGLHRFQGPLFKSPPAQQEPVATVRTWHKNGDQHAELDDWGLAIALLPDGTHNLYTSPPVQRKPLTDKMVLIAARVMSDRQADACNVDKEDQWKVYGQDFIDDARAMLEAAHNIKENT